MAKNEGNNKSNDVFSELGEAQFERKFVKFRDEFSKLQNEAIELARTHAPAFNIFNLLGVTRDEIRTHSAFISSLLNPGGSHGQGLLFLDRFQRMCRGKYDTFPPIQNIDEGKWTSYSEVGIQKGRLDVVVINPHTGHLIVIENKVYAYTQADQLARYGKWMDGRKTEYPYQALIYLTIRGISSSSAFDHPYFKLSYREDIFSWLDKSLGNIQAPGVKEVVRQYIDIIRQL